MASSNQQEKYDRQIRLWGLDGQTALMNTHILLVNAGPTGSETLKNLVLPGIKQFTIVDDQLTQESDLGNNFFVTANRLGEPRAKVVKELIEELNPDVQGEYRQGKITSILQEDPSFFASFDLIVACQTPPEALLEIAAECDKLRLPLITVRSIGLIGHLRLQVHEHTIVDSKPDSDRNDLRIVNPFPALEAYASSFDLNNMDSLQHAHVPYIVILMHALTKWKKNHANTIPKTTEEKNQFKDVIKSMARGQWGHEANFIEALDHAYKAYIRIDPAYEVQETLKIVPELTKDSSEFWVCVAAIKEFVAVHNSLPASGHVPDMTSTTENYIQLQRIYQAKAQEDYEWILKWVYDKLELLERERTEVAADLVNSFCKNANRLQVVVMNQIRREYEHPNVEELQTQLMLDDSAQNPCLWYVMLRALDEFTSKNARFPELNDQDAEQIDQIAQGLAQKWDLRDTKLSLQHAQEITRYGRAEVHAIAALMGGMAAQEIVKVRVS